MIIMIIRERTTLKIHEVTELSTFNKYVVLEVIKTFYWPGAELRAHNHHGKCCSHVPKTLHLHPLQLSIYFKQSVIQHNICETIIINIVYWTTDPLSVASRQCLVIFYHETSWRYPLCSFSTKKSLSEKLIYNLFNK